MDYVDYFIGKLLKESENTKYTITDELINAAQIASESEEISSLQASLVAARRIVEPRHMQLIIESDMNADSIQRAERILLLESWSAKKMFPDCPSQLYSIALDRCLDSEIILSKGDLTIRDVLFHRTRSFVYTMIFVLKEYLLPMFLMSHAALEHTCIFALVAVLLDDAEDFGEDKAADSPTLFTLYPLEAGHLALQILAHLSTLEDDFSSIEGMLSTKPFMLLAIYQVRAFMGLELSRKSVDTRAFLKMLAVPDCIEKKRNWRNHKSHDSL